MRIFEFEEDPRLNAKLVVASDELKSDLDKNKFPDGMTTDQLLDYFQDFDVILDITDLYNMIKVPPLKQIISNIQGDDVIFKGEEELSSDFDEPDKQKKVVSKMAKHAMK